MCGESLVVSVTKPRWTSYEANNSMKGLQAKLSCLKTTVHNIVAAMLSECHWFDSPVCMSKCPWARY